MKKYKLKQMVASMMLLMMITSLLSCERAISDFTGNSTGNNEQFLLDFEALNITESNQMDLKQGDKIQATITIDKGSVDINVKDEKGTVAYKVSDAETTTLTFEILEQGTYTFSVTGYRAAGSVHFVKVSEEKA